MCSLSNSMASFKIHEDDENNFPNALSAKLKELGPIQPKRSALGVVNVNVDPAKPNLKIGQREGEKLDELLTKENVSVPGALVGKKPVLGDSKLHAEPTCSQIAKKVIPESTLAEAKENKFDDKPVGFAAGARKDKLWTDSLNVQAEQKAHRSPLKDKENVQDDVKPQDEKTVSPMLLGDSPAETVPLPLDIKLQLEDLYACVTYKDDIFKYLKHRETLFKPKPYYMKRQPDVTYTMRTILVDWLVEVGEEYKLGHQTLFMTVNFVDRFLSSMAVVRAKLQLLGTAAMFLAAKFEEIYPPEVSEFTYITDDTYSKKQVLRMENLILKVLDFNLSTPTSYTFIMHISASTRMPEKVMFLSIFICELSLLEADPYLERAPSIIACGAIALARHCLGYVDVWPSYLHSTTGYTLKQLAPVVQHLNETHAKSFTSAQAAIREKYKAPKFQFVSTVPHKKLSIRIES